ncbi:MAG: RNase adapter RapZ [Sphingomonadaceae bacterium]|nr:RNase adapter RapZ [Sphingomonadaceae bacterium]MCP5384425.1 RNase adapter RapZ [Altererythrobacter sp.]MCP5390684.1 RNase adapter RapZ [Sphingomonadaceae bacterium]MCP5393751.1 RNase adapter RapZ [Sphingomonadaceae bacterium]
MPADSPEPDQALPDERQRILLVTGLSGAGKTTALRVLEDLGWEAIDNFPIRLLGRLVGAEGERHTSGPLAIGFDSRTRGFVPHDIIERVKKLTARSDVLLTTLFIDCGSGELERRYNETRRRHPMASGRPVRVGIQAERELLEPLRRWADAVIDTTEYSSNDLQQAIREAFSHSAPQEMSIILSSFGFARGTPPLADLVFDMRFLDNPHWVEELREQTGLDEPVGAYVRKDPAFATAFAQMRDLLLTLLPRYRAQGKSYVNIGFGCTGGRHRSVYTTAQMDEALRSAGFSPTVIHRNLGSRAADEIEGRKA